MPDGKGGGAGGNGEDRRFRILALDGGGIKGTYTAAFLARIEEMSGKRIVDHFDLIAGTSTGGIIALGLGLGVSAKDILQFYEEEGPRIFPLMGMPTRLRALLRQALRPKHKTTALQAALSEVFGRRVLGESLTRLVITSYDGSSGDVRLFKTAHHEKLKEDYQTPAVDVALATSAAPTYLPAFVGSCGTTLVDGGVWSNCPAAAAVIEALTVLKQPRHLVELLTVGTTEEPLHVSDRRATGGGVRWVRFATDVFLQAQMKAALAHAKLLTDDRLVRITEVVERKRFDLDDPKGIHELKALGYKGARHRYEEVSGGFLQEPAAPFIPFRGPRSVSRSGTGA